MQIALQGLLVLEVAVRIRANAVVVDVLAGEDARSRGTAERRRGVRVRVAPARPSESAARTRHHSHRPAGPLVVGHDDEHVRWTPSPPTFFVRLGRGRARLWVLLGPRTGALTRGDQRRDHDGNEGATKKRGAKRGHRHEFSLTASSTQGAARRPVPSARRPGRAPTNASIGRNCGLPALTRR